jgi:hypothetical protein
MLDMALVTRESPPYVAWMEWVPAERFDTTSTAAPLATVAVPSGIAPSMNWTVPVAVEGTSVAVNRTGLPMVEGLISEVRVTPPTPFTVSLRMRDEAWAKLASPRY